MTTGGPKKLRMDQDTLNMVDASPRQAKIMFDEVQAFLSAGSEGLASHLQVGTMPIMSVMMTIIMQSWLEVDEKLGRAFVRASMQACMAETDGEADNAAAKARDLYEKLGKIAYRQQLQRMAGAGDKPS